MVNQKFENTITVALVDPVGSEALHSCGGSLDPLGTRGADSVADALADHYERRDFIIQTTQRLVEHAERRFILRAAFEGELAQAILPACPSQRGSAHKT